MGAVGRPSVYYRWAAWSAGWLPEYALYAGVVERGRERVAIRREGARVGAAALCARFAIDVGGALRGQARPRASAVLIDKKPNVIGFVRAETALKLIYILGAARADAQL